MTPWIKILRPAQWLKNLILFFPSFFNGSLVSDLGRMQSITAFISFCLAASSMYIFNDVVDAEKDKLHPGKKSRPIPSGVISKTKAISLGLILLVLAILLGLWVSTSFLLLLSAYLIISLLYSLRLKNLAIFDIFCVALGFLLRLQAGGAACHIHISEWLFLTVFLLALFLSTGKRLFEKVSLGKTAVSHRVSLNVYPENFLDGTMFMSGGAVLVSYAIYIISRSRPGLFYTLPLCCFALLRYIFLAKSGLGGDPTDCLLHDMPILIITIIWTIMIGWGIYAG